MSAAGFARGGSWNFAPQDLRSAVRHWFPPAIGAASLASVSGGRLPLESLPLYLFTSLPLGSRGFATWVATEPVHR
jgi:hypothetical protein